MANSSEIFKRGSSDYLRVILPKSHTLRNTYKSGKVIISLEACSYREAVTAGAIKRAQILETKEPISSIASSLPPKSGILSTHYPPQ